MQNKLEQLQRNKENRKTIQNKDRKRKRGFKYNGNKKQAGHDQKPSAMEKRLYREPRSTTNYSASKEQN